ncbi:oxepin-CoA hydrolase, alternative type [Xylophilus sp. GOD-11R]|uniref:oxepin-CoA hydrolase, alternative type n=1 Tax=Xylophilus sp. GOD-11R TaxID=3089814 RepID=UPI00298CB3E4|nr:enoyl-CoA hydratase family protein [Xylophilus sp. GOD-11R]WPB57340.1 enoyl-CoA hydratase family protein [Xylophilus sp. GOD-11R]
MSGTTTGQLLLRREGPVLVMTIANPALRNALHPAMYRGGAQAVREAAADPAVRAIVLTGEGEHFCGGGDLNRLRRQRELPAHEQHGHLDALHDWVMALQESPQPVIAAVEGAAAGGGFSVCLGCDLVVAAEDAVFVMSYARIGLSPDGGGSDSLARALPPQAALELLLDGGKVTPQRLHGWGLINRLVPHGQALATALEWAQRLARGAAGAQADIKRLVYGARHRERRAQLDAERDAFVANLYGEHAGRAIAAFLDKTPTHPT